MKFIIEKDINPTIGSLYIDTFEIPEDPKDVGVLKKILSLLFQDNQQLFFVCSGENKKPTEETLLQKKQIEEYFAKNGKFFEAEVAEGQDIHCCGALIQNQKTKDFIISLWAYFKSVAIFAPAADLTWESFASYDITLFDIREDARKMLSFHFMEMVAMKGKGGESLLVNYLKGYKLPDLHKVVGH